MSSGGPVMQMERRKHPRVRVWTNAFLFDRSALPRHPGYRPRALGRFNVLDLSVGGALIEGDVGVPLGADIGVHMQLPRTDIQVAAVVLRRDRSPSRRTFAISFQVVPARDANAVSLAVAAVLGEVDGRHRVVSGGDGTAREAAWLTLREMQAVLGLPPRHR